MTDESVDNDRDVRRFAAAGVAGMVAVAAHGLVPVRVEFRRDPEG